MWPRAGSPTPAGPSQRSTRRRRGRAPPNAQARRSCPPRPGGGHHQVLQARPQRPQPLHRIIDHSTPMVTSRSLRRSAPLDPRRSTGKPSTTASGSSGGTPAALRRHRGGTAGTSGSAARPAVGDPVGDLVRGCSIGDVGHRDWVVVPRNLIPRPPDGFPCFGDQAQVPRVWRAYSTALAALPSPARWGPPY